MLEAMPLSNSQKNEIETILSGMLTRKLSEYARETSVMPFLDRLMAPERVALFSFIQSVATSLGISIYEQMSKICAGPNSQEVENHVRIGGTLNDAQNAGIKRIVGELRREVRRPNKSAETREILSISARGGVYEKNNDIVDFKMKRDGEEYYFELKTAKPNIGNFVSYKEELLQWVARKQKPVHTYLVFPYNPYAPEPYQRFTQLNMIDEKHELLVGKDYWDFLGGFGTYEELLAIFDRVGKNYKDRIAKKMDEIGSTRKSMTSES